MAMRLPRMHRRHRDAAEHVRPLGDGLQVVGANAAAISAEMVDLKPRGNRSAVSQIHLAVRSE